MKVSNWFACFNWWDWTIWDETWVHDRQVSLSALGFPSPSIPSAGQSPHSSGCVSWTVIFTRLWHGVTFWFIRSPLTAVPSWTWAPLSPRPFVANALPSFVYGSPSLTVDPSRSTTPRATVSAWTVLSMNWLTVHFLYSLHLPVASSPSPPWCCSECPHLKLWWTTACPCCASTVQTSLFIYKITYSINTVINLRSALSIIFKIYASLTRLHIVSPSIS